MSEPPLDKRIAEFLAARHVVTLATNESDAVHAASVLQETRYARARGMVFITCYLAGQIFTKSPRKGIVSGLAGVR